MRLNTPKRESGRLVITLPTSWRGHYESARRLHERATNHDGIAVERGVEQAMKDVLERAGVVDDGDAVENAQLAHTKGGGS